ncbi:unnamed protein product, partial [Cuscuta campestris]
MASTQSSYAGLGEGQSTTRPPLFDRMNYTYSKERMRIYIQSTNFLLWRIIKNGEDVPMKKVGETNVPKTENEYDAQDIKKVENNAKTINIIYCAVNPDDYWKISCCSTAKEMWDKLEITYEADATQESIGITNVTIDGLRGNLKTYESTILFPSLGEQKKKGIALKASTSQEPIVEESSDEDNEFGLVIKKFHKFMRKEYERKSKRHGGPPKCYGCGEVGHIKPKCPNAKNEKEKKPLKKHRAYISWGGDSGDEPLEGEENESANLCLMAHEEPPEEAGIKDWMRSSLEKVEETNVPKTEDEYDAQDIKKVENNAKAINIIYCVVNPDDYRKISCCTTVKEMWDKLEITYEGTDQVREAKIDFLTHEYELFRMKENEKIDEMFERFSKIVNDLHALKKTYTDKEFVRKILRSLTPKWRSKADAIQESIGITNVTIDGLRGNLKTYESTILFPSLGEQKKKGIALKATSSQEPAMEESSDEDNEFGLVIKKFHKFMRKEYERKGKKHGGPPKCYGCGEVGHIKPKCPNAKNEKEKKPFKKHRAYISWGGDSGD